MSISSKGKYLNPNYAYGVNEDYDKNDIIYYNLSLNAGFNTLSPFVPDFFRPLSKNHPVLVSIVKMV